MICGSSWGSPDTGWTWCILQRGHLDPCADYAGQPQPAAVLTFAQQPEAAAAIEKQVADAARIAQAKNYERST